jgi:hypothetical protein
MLSEEEWFRFANGGISGPVVACSLPSRLSTAIDAGYSKHMPTTRWRFFYATVEYACNAFAIGLVL